MTYRSYDGDYNHGVVYNNDTGFPRGVRGAFQRFVFSLYTPFFRDIPDQIKFNLQTY